MHIYSLAIDPENTNIIYVGTDDGVFKTTDGGVSWKPINNGLDTIKKILSLAVNPINTQIIYAGLFGGGVFKSINGGASWTGKKNGLIGFCVNCFAVDPQNPQVIYAGTNTVVFKSTNGGTSWASMKNGLTNFGIMSLVIDPTNTQVVYAGAAGDGVFKIVQKVISIILHIGSTTFTVNGVPNQLDSPPIIKNGRTLLPIRAVVEALGGTVSWNDSEKKVTISHGTNTIELWIGKSTAKLNGTNKPIDSTNSKVVPEIVNGRTMLPLRFVTENLGCDVQWNDATKTITITYQG